MSHTYLTTEELAMRMKYDARTIRNRLKDALFRGGHVSRADGRTTVELAPFADDPNRARMHGFDTLTLRFVLGDDPKAPIREMVAATAGPVAAELPRRLRALQGVDEESAFATTVGVE